MADLALKALQFKGKVRRFIQVNLNRQDTAAWLERRQGECNRCGECCKLVFRCPFLATDAEGNFACRIYEQRFTQCRLFPLHAADLREVSQCSYSFTPAPTPVPALAFPDPVQD